MPRTTKVVGLSLPPEIHNKVERYIREKHKTRSEFFREMIDVYFSKNPKTDTSDRETDIANSLKKYWQLRATSDLKVIVIGLGIISNKDGKILIGSRKGKDKWVKNLGWVFPGGEMNSLDFKTDILKKVHEETNLNTNLENLVSVRIHPDSGFNNVQIVAFYFNCSAPDKSTLKPGGSLKELKWVKPLDVFKYFTTSTSDEVTKFLKMSQKSQN